MKTWEQRFKIFSLLACLATVGISLTALLGMYLDKPSLRQWFGEGPPMRFNTAVALTCAGVSLILRSQDPRGAYRKLGDRSGLALGTIPLLMGLVTLFEFAMDTDFGVDLYLYTDSLIPRGFPGRPSPEMALNLVILGSAILLIKRPERGLKVIQRSLSLLFLSLPLLTLIASFFGADQFYSVFPSYQNAVGSATNTAVASILLSFALFFRPPIDGFAALFIQETVGGMIARRHLMTVIIVPVFIAFLSQFEEVAGLSDRPISLALAMLLALGGLIAFNWVTASKLDRLDQQKQIDQQLLKEQERLLRAVLDAVPVGIWIADASGKIIRSNPAGCQIWGGQPYMGIEEYGAYKAWWAETGQTISSHEWALARAVEKGETSVDETIQIECFNGRRKVILNSAMPLRNEDDVIVGGIVTNYDITQRYSMERNQALVARAGEELITMRDLPSILERVTSLLSQEFCDSCLIYLVDENHAPRLAARGQRKGSQAAEFEAVLNRYPPNTKTNLGLLSVLESRRSLLISKVDETVLESLAHNAEHAALLRQMLQSYMFVPMIAEDKKIGVLGFISYDRNRLYTKIDLMAAEELGRLAALAIENTRYAERLKEAVQAREDVVAIVSHDLRSPLTVIMQSCDLITRQLKKSESSDQIIRIAQLARSAGLRMHELIANLLDLSHLDSSQFVLHYEDFEGLDVIRETLDLLRPLASEKTIGLALDVPASLPLFHMDRTRLCQILNNLITNAIKYTPPGGSVALSVHRRDDGWLEFNVTDTGVGIKKDYLPMLFERYWKPYDSKGGFGLGLFVVKGIVEAHGGQVHVTSEEGQGTSFTFTLPSTLIQEHSAGDALSSPSL